MAIWKWSDIGQYSATSTYHMLCEGSICFLCTMMIWRCWAPLSCKIFLWLALQYPSGRLIGDCDTACKTKALSVSFVIKKKALWIVSSFNVCSLGRSGTYVSQGQRSLFRFLRWQIGLNRGGLPVGSFFWRSIVEVLTLWLLLCAGAYGNNGTEESSEGEISSMSGSLRLLFSKSSNFGLLRGRNECYHSVNSRLDL